MVLLIGKVTNMLATAAPQPLTYSRHSGGPEKNPIFIVKLKCYKTPNCPVYTFLGILVVKVTWPHFVLWLSTFDQNTSKCVNLEELLIFCQFLERNLTFWCYEFFGTIHWRCNGTFVDNGSKLRKLVLKPKVSFLATGWTCWLATACNQLIDVKTNGDDTKKMIYIFERCLKIEFYFN